VSFIEESSPHQPLASRRDVLRATAAVVAGTALSGYALAAEPAASFPSRPVRMVIPLPAGGATDVIARIFGQKLGELWHQSVIVDNKPGAGTIVGTQLIAKAPADGYTFGMVISAFTINPSLRSDLPYDATKDFTPLSLLGFPVIALVAIPSFPANDVAGLIAQARAKPGAVSYASLGIGTATHLAGELMNVRAKTGMVHIPYNGSAPAYNDLLSGRVPVGFVLLDSALPHVKAGKLKVLAVTNAHRSKIYPDYPTVGETIPGYSLESLFGFVAPRGVPAPVAAKLSGDIIKVTQMPEVRQRLAELSVEPVGSTAAEFGATIRSEIVKWAPIVKAAGVKTE
jgi:tripartite-type tricarboxylate transporter receptor subunit TctC